VSTRRRIAVPITIALSIALACSTAKVALAADPPETTYTVALERIAVLSYSTVPIVSTFGGLTRFTTLGGIIHDPYAMPRIALDATVPSGITIGTAFAYGRVDSGATHYEAVLLNVHGGYRFQPHPRLSFVPRLGVTGIDLSSGVDDTELLRAIAISPEFVANVAFTPQALILAGISFDRVVYPSKRGDGAPREVGFGPLGHYGSLSVWLGFGGVF
jgi:hypothetical protein